MLRRAVGSVQTVDLRERGPRSALPVLVSLLGLIAEAPTSPERGRFYLLRGLLNALARAGERGRQEQCDASAMVATSVHIRVLGALAAYPLQVHETDALGTGFDDLSEER